MQLQGPTLDQHGYLVDIVDINTHLEALVGHYRDKTLNDLPEFKDLNPSLEHFARIFCQALSERIQASNLSACHHQNVGERDHLGGLPTGAVVHIGLIIYGSLDTLTGGYLYDRLLVEHLRRQGDQVDIISLPWRTYGRHLGDNFSRNLYGRLRRAPFDALLQDELNHPSLFWLNQRLRRSVRYPIVTIVHLLRCSEPRPAWHNRLYRWVERRYLIGLDGLVFNSQTTQVAVEQLVGSNHPSVVAYPGGDHLPPALTPQQIKARTQQPGPLRILFVGNLTPVKGLQTSPGPGACAVGPMASDRGRKLDDGP